MTKIEKNPKTEADIQLLMRVFPDLLPDGRCITHEQIEAVLKIPRLASRYRTVVRKWRRQLFDERHVWLDGQTAEGKGFIALTPDEMVRYGNRGVRSAGRKLKKAIVVMSAPSDGQLSEGLRQYRQLLLAATEKIIREHRSTLREVGRALAPMKQLPRASSE